MKKVTLVLAALAILGSLSFTSCKKCSTCIARNAATGTQLATSGEFCGNKAYVEETEDSFKSSWGLIGTVTCE